MGTFLVGVINLYRGKVQRLLYLGEPFIASNCLDSAEPAAQMLEKELNGECILDLVYSVMHEEMNPDNEQCSACGL